MLSLDEYNRLRDLKERVSSGKNFAIRTPHGSIKYFTESEAVAEIAEINQKLAKERNELKDTLSRVNHMSWFEFRAWKRQLNILNMI